MLLEIKSGDFGTWKCNITLENGKLFTKNQNLSEEKDVTNNSSHHDSRKKVKAEDKKNHEENNEESLDEIYNDNYDYEMPDLPDDSNGLTFRSKSMKKVENEEKHLEKGVAKKPKHDNINEKNNTKNLKKNKSSTKKINNYDRNEKMKSMKMNNHEKGDANIRNMKNTNLDKSSADTDTNLELIQPVEGIETKVGTNIDTENQKSKVPTKHDDKGKNGKVFTVNSEAKNTKQNETKAKINGRGRNKKDSYWGNESEGAFSELGAKDKNQKLDAVDKYSKKNQHNNNPDESKKERHSKGQSQSVRRPFEVHIQPRRDVKTAEIGFVTKNSSKHPKKNYERFELENGNFKNYTGENHKNEPEHEKKFDPVQHEYSYETVNYETVQDQEDHGAENGGDYTDIHMDKKKAETRKNLVNDSNEDYVTLEKPWSLLEAVAPT